jgi:hypothetical protein
LKRLLTIIRAILMKSRTPDEEPESKRIRRARYPFPFYTLREGDKDPTLGKHVDWLIDSDKDYIVYIDEQGYVEWNMNRNDMLGPATGPSLNKIGWLEAVDTSHLECRQRESYQRMIGEGVARLFQKNLGAAQAAFDLADEWITARNNEVARRWYLRGSGAVAVLSLLAVFILGVRMEELHTKFPPDVYNILMGTAVGGLGAWLSIVQRSRRTELDVAAGPLLHHLEGAFRIIAGTLGAFLVALAIQADLINGVKEILKGLPAIMVVCMVAGTSERIVPSLIEQIESRAVGRDGRARSADHPQPGAREGIEKPFERAGRPRRPRRRSRKRAR